MPCIGISHETVAQGAETTLLTYGMLSGIDTTAMGSSGLYLYVSSTQGALTKSPPVLLNEDLQQVATVLNNAVSGTILVDIGSNQYNRFNLGTNEFAYGGQNGEQKANFSTILNFDNRLLSISGSNGKGLGISSSRHIHFQPAASGTHPNGLAYTKRTIITGALQSDTSGITSTNTDSNPLNSLIYGMQNNNAGQNNTMFGRSNTITRYNNENVFGGEGNETVNNTYGNDRNLVAGKYNSLEGGVVESVVCGYGSRIIRTAWSANFGVRHVNYECNRLLTSGLRTISHAAHDSINVGTIDEHNPVGGATAFHFSQQIGMAPQGVYTNISIGGSRSSQNGVNGEVTISVSATGAIINITATNSGSNYQVGETITLPQNAIGNNNTFSFKVKRIVTTRANIYSFTNAEESAVFGKANSIGAGSRGSVCFGYQNRIGSTRDQTQSVSTASTGQYYMPYATVGFAGPSNGFDKPALLSQYSFVTGTYNRIGESSSSFVAGNNNQCESNYSFIAGGSNTIGAAGGNHYQALIGQGLLSPQHSGSVNIGSGQVVVGKYNDKTDFDGKLRNTPNGGWFLNNSQVFSVGSGADHSNRKTSFVIVPRQTDNSTSRDFCGIAMPALAGTASYGNDSQAEQGGVPVGGLYRDGSVIKIRVQ